MTAVVARFWAAYYCRAWCSAARLSGAQPNTHRIGAKLRNLCRMEVLFCSLVGSLPAGPGGSAASGPCERQMLFSPPLVGTQVITYWPVAGSLLKVPARPGSGQCGVSGRSSACVVARWRPRSLPRVVWGRSLVSSRGHSGDVWSTLIVALLPFASWAFSFPGVTN